jgi:hypothetical protein
VKWIVLTLFALAALLFGVGTWTRIVGRSADERGDAGLPFLLGAIVLAIDILLIVGWAVVRLFFA